MAAPESPPARDRHPTHDSGYKLIYSHAEMVRDLLQGFVPATWLRDLDLSTLEKCSGSYVSDDLRERADDIVWRLRWGEDWLYLYLLLEFQSSIDVWMAVRIQTYVGLLYQDLIRSKQLGKARRLPLVLPIVLYNGSTAWDAAQSLDHLIEPPPLLLNDYVPRQRYYLIDEVRVAEQGRLPDRNLSAALFRLEASRAPEEVLGILHAMVDWLKAPEQTSLRRAFTVWFNRVFLPRRLPGVAFESMSDLHEVRHMLSERVESWTEQWEQQGLARGLEQGLEQGREESRHLLVRLVRRRFGPAIAVQSESLLAAIAAPAQLEDIGERLLTAPDGATWLDWLRQAADGH